MDVPTRGVYSIHEYRITDSILSGQSVVLRALSEYRCEIDTRQSIERSKVESREKIRLNRWFFGTRSSSWDS
jgi:hypothetical protein